MFSRRVPNDLGPNRLAEARSRLAEIPFDLSISNPTGCALPYPSDLLSALADPSGLGYRPDPRGPKQVRAAIARSYRRWRAEVDPSNVILTASTSEAYSLLFKLLCDPGDAVLIPTPSYPLFEQLARLDGIEIRPFDLDPDDDWRPDLGSIETSGRHPRAVVIVHPNNPTGSFVHPDDATGLATLCQDRGWALVADEVFLPFTLDGGPGAFTSFAGADRALTFTLGGLSKSLGLPQLKLAWIVIGGPDEAVEEARDRLGYINDAYLSVSTPIALAAPRLFDDAAVVHQAIADRCRRNLETLRRVATGLPAATVPPVGGGWSVPLRLPAVIDDEEAALILLRDKGVAVQPGYFFDLPNDCTLVLSLLTPELVWRAGLEEIFSVVRGWL